MEDVKDDLPTQIEEVDALKLQLLIAKLEALQAKADKAFSELQAQRSALDAVMQEKYALKVGDQVDPNTREIKRG